MRHRTKPDITDFSFMPAGFGHYTVTYTSPATGKGWRYTTSDMPLIDATKNAEQPKQEDLDQLKWQVKKYGFPMYQNHDPRR